MDDDMLTQSDLDENGDPKSPGGSTKKSGKHGSSSRDSKGNFDFIFRWVPWDRE